MSDQLTIRNNAISKLGESQLDFILLDGSGSMSSKWWPMLDAIDTYIAELKAATIDSHVVLDIFDTIDIALRARDTHISQWKTFAEDPVGAHWGGTPLWDAIVMMGKAVRELNPQRCSITIVTDGDNHRSDNKFSDLTMAKAVLRYLKARGFTITWIGCDFDNDAQIKELGASPQNALGVRREKLKEAAKLLGSRRVKNARTGEDINFTDDEKTKFGGYLGHSKS